MPTVFAHAAVAGALGQTASAPLRRDWRFWYMAILCAALPDLDVLSFRLGIPYEAPGGHRGMSHSLVMAAVIGTLAAMRFRWLDPGQRRRLAALFILITASHGFFDAFTNGGLGVAFFAPFDERRYFFPWQPIEVSPIGGRFFLSSRGAAVLWNELRWIILPSLVVGVLLRAWHRRR